MRMFSPYVFSRLRQTAVAVSYDQGICSLGIQYALSRRSPTARQWFNETPRSAQRMLGLLLSFAIFLLNTHPAACAVENIYAPTIEQMSSDVDNEVKKLGGIKLVMDHLRKSFHVDDGLIYTVREQEIAYGDMFTVFAMAEQMPGGINEDNVVEVIDIHQGRMAIRTWDNVAELLGVDMGRVVERVRDLTTVFLVPSNLEAAVQ